MGGGRLNPTPYIAAKVLPNDRVYAHADLYTTNQRPIELFIGSDQCFLLTNKEGVQRLRPSSVVLDTMFGWIPAGSVSNHLLLTDVSPNSLFIPVMPYYHSPIKRTAH